MEQGLSGCWNPADAATSPLAFHLCVARNPSIEVAALAKEYKCGGLYQRFATMRGVALACVLSSASAFLGGSPALKVRHAKSSPQIAAQAPPARSVALQMSSALAEESGVSLSSGGGMFTTSSPEDRRIGTELFVSGVRYRERRYPKLKSAHRPQNCAEAAKASTAAPRGAPAARGAPVTQSSAAERRLAGARKIPNAT